MRAPRAAKPNMLDRVVGYFSPMTALRNIQARTMMQALGGYDGGKKSRRQTQNWVLDEGSANADTMADLPTLRARSRDLRRNMPIASGAIETRIDNVVGEGLKVFPQVKRDLLGMTPEQARAWNEKAKAEFELAAWTADMTGVHCFEELQALLFGAVDESGDAFVVRRWKKRAGDTYGTKIQVIEADRVSNPNHTADTDKVVGGIEADESGFVQAYHISNRHPGDVMRKALSWRRVPAFYTDGRPIVLHLFKRKRPDQARGVPHLAPVIEALKQFGTYTEAELQAAVISAYFTVFVKTASPDNSPIPTTDTNTSSGKEEAALGSGAIIDLAMGEDISIANPNRPNPNFDAFALAMLRQIGVGLGLPLELLIKHFTASYSASRAALEIAWQTFRRERTWLVRNLCQPFYEWVIEEAVIMGRLEAPGFFDDPAIRRAWLNADWFGQVKISLDPLKDANADKQDLENLTKTRQQIVQERTGGNVEDKFEQLGMERKMAVAAGLISEQPTTAGGANPSAPAAPANGAGAVQYAPTDMEDSDSV